MKTVAIVINTAWNIYNFRLNLARALKKEGYNIVCIAPYDAIYTPKIEQEFPFYSIQFDAKGINPLKDIATVIALWRLYRNIKPDIVLNYTIKPNLYSTLVAYVLGIKVITNISGLGTLFIKLSFLTRFVQVLYKIALHFSCKVFFQNEEDRDLFIKKGLVAKEKCLLVAGSGVDLRKFSPRFFQKEDEIIRFLFVARMLKDKGLVELVEAFQVLKKNYPYVQVYLLGAMGIENPTAITQEEMQYFIKEKSIVYLGSNDNVADILATMDCAVLPSYREGTSRSLLEAAAMAKPIVTTNVPGCKNVVDNGVNGFLCEPKNINSLYLAMEKIVVLSPNEREQMGIEGRKKMVNTFDEIFVIKDYITTLKEALNSF